MLQKSQGWTSANDEILRWPIKLTNNEAAERREGNEYVRMTQTRGYKRHLDTLSLQRRRWTQKYEASSMLIRVAQKNLFSSKMSRHPPKMCQMVHYSFLPSFNWVCQLKDGAHEGSIKQFTRFRVIPCQFTRGFPGDHLRFTWFFLPDVDPYD